MQQSSNQTYKFWLSIPEISLGTLPSSPGIRYTLTGVIKSLLQKTGNSVTSEIVINQELLSSQTKLITQNN